MPAHVLVWDLETVPDLRGFAAANGLDDRSDDDVRAAIGDKFPKHIYHSIICIRALIAHREGGHWATDAVGAPHVGERREKELISSFVERIAQLSPQLVTFNGSSFDLPVLRCRAIVNGVRHTGIKGLPGKPGGISGGDVEKFYREGRIGEIADYCETDVVIPTALAAHGLPRGTLTNNGLQISEADLSEYLKRRGEAKAHLANLIT